MRNFLKSWSSGESKFGIVILPKAYYTTVEIWFRIIYSVMETIINKLPIFSFQLRFCIPLAGVRVASSITSDFCWVSICWCFQNGISQACRSQCFTHSQWIWAESESQSLCLGLPHCCPPHTHTKSQEWGTEIWLYWQYRLLLLLIWKLENTSDQQGFQVIN